MREVVKSGWLAGLEARKRVTLAEDSIGGSEGYYYRRRRGFCSSIREGSYTAG